MLQRTSQSLVRMDAVAGTSTSVTPRKENKSLTRGELHCAPDVIRRVSLAVLNKSPRDAFQAVTCPSRCAQIHLFVPPYLTIHRPHPITCRR